MELGFAHFEYDVGETWRVGGGVLSSFQQLSEVRYRLRKDRGLVRIISSFADFKLTPKNKFKR